jgi:hypothetical protein
MSQPPTHDDLSRLKNKQCETEHHMVYGHHPNTIHDPRETIRLNNIATVELAMIYAYGAGQQTMPGSCLDPWEILPMIQCASGTPPGCFIEVGVYKGGSAWHLTKLAKVQERELWLYDTFEGLVDYTPGVDTLPFGLLNEPDAKLAVVRQTLGPYPRIVQGIFPDSFVPPETGVAFAHIDVDQYQSTVNTIAALAPHMVPGGVMWFDDTGGGTGGLEGARKAVADSFTEEAILVDPVTKRWLVVFA